MTNLVAFSKPFLFNKTHIRKKSKDAVNRLHWFFILANARIGSFLSYTFFQPDNFSFGILGF